MLHLWCIIHDKFNVRSRLWVMERRTRHEHSSSAALRPYVLPLKKAFRTERIDEEFAAGDLLPRASDRRASLSSRAQPLLTPDPMKCSFRSIDGAISPRAVIANPSKGMLVQDEVSRQGIEHGIVAMRRTMCQRRSKNTSVCRRENTSVLLARRPRTGGLFLSIRLGSADPPTCPSWHGVSGVALNEPVAVAVHLQDMDVMGEPVEQRTGEPLGTEHAGPFVERQV